MVIRKITLSPRLIMFLSFAGMSIVNYAFGLAAGWLLMPGDFGLLAFAQTILTISGLVLNAGFTWSLTAALVEVDHSRRTALIRGTAIANLLLSVAMSLVILLLFAWGPLRSGLETWWIAGLVSLSLPCISLIATTRGALQGGAHFSTLALLLVVEVIGKASSGVLLILLGVGTIGAIAGFLIGAAVAAILSVTLLVRMFGIDLLGPVQRPSLRISGELFGALLGMALLLNLDILALKLFSGSDRAVTGYYQAAIVLANTPYYLTSAMIPILFTRVARVKAIEKTGLVVEEAFRFAMLFLFPAEALLVLIPNTILGLLFPEAYTAGAATLRILAIGNCGIILVVILSATFQATGNARVPASILLAIVTSEALALYALVPVWHAIGAALLFLAATITALLCLGTSYLRCLGYQRVYDISIWLLKYVIALTVGCIAIIMLLNFTLSLVLALGLGGVSYLLVAFTMGLLPLPKRSWQWDRSILRR